MATIVSNPSWRHVGASAAADAPRVLCSANIHGPEWIGCETALALLDAAALGRAIADADRVVSI